MSAPDKEVRIRVSRRTFDGILVDVHIILDDTTLKHIVNPQGYVGFRVIEMINKVNVACNEPEVRP